ncbi:Lrp/AsnC family transcriptional regulator [Chryseobacterium sp. RLHN22]|uniref:Lrp/AsnC family transcriptional regulator n=1 Tax=Chryseobacterium sp. RLHN22 TaxID=3437885 RepID=UPI003D9B8198
MTANQNNLDEKDISILKVLEKNSKLSIREIAIRVNLSPTPTHERIKKMEKNGVIKDYTINIERKKIDKGLMVFCMIALNVHNKTTAGKFIEDTSKLKEVIELHNISGDFDFMLKIIAKDMDDFHTFFLNKLSEIEGIGQTKSIFVMNTLKENIPII